MQLGQVVCRRLLLQDRAKMFQKDVEVTMSAQEILMLVEPIRKGSSGSSRLQERLDED